MANGVEKDSAGKENESARRRSSRIQAKQQAEKELLVRRRRVELLEEEGGDSPRKKPRGRRTLVITDDNPIDSSYLDASDLDAATVENLINDSDLGAATVENLINASDLGAATVDNPIHVLDLGASDTVDNAITVSDLGAGAATDAEKIAYTKVRETMRLYQEYYLQFCQEEQKRCKKKVSKDGKPKRTSKRPDLKAIDRMKEKNEILCREKKLGSIPGIDVGHKFYSRAELVALGVHSEKMSGIDFMGKAYAKGEYSHYIFPLAVAIVLSGEYEDDVDNAEEVIYTGQGGNDSKGSKQQIKDQVLAGGNLALKNCVGQDVSVRVIRGHKTRGHKTAGRHSSKIYTYDGLYKVIKFWADRSKEEKDGATEGKSGFTVYKYKLQRCEGQLPLTTNPVQFIYGPAPESISEIRGLVCDDISGGLEKILIPATNSVDDSPFPPKDYTYTESMKVAEKVKLPTNAVGCDCKGDKCENPRTCSCAKLNGSDFPYVDFSPDDSPDLRLIKPKDIIYECGPSCGCGPNCINRTSQRGIRYPLEVFRTVKKGWAVRSWEFIPSGAPVCEYIGVLNREEDVDHVSSENDYIFDIDCLQTMRGLDGRERRERDATTPKITNADKLEDQKSDAPEYCIDAGSIGNVARFVNHSCEPNLFIQCVLNEHHDWRLARVMLFASGNIPALQELTYDYGYALDSVHDSDGKVKQMPCHCGSRCCRKRLY